ncbi:hypothetical protein KZZ52_02635 [Dactylosporangium sp. AC04546]|uniref:hypothetical protein n=1 Tax=Dactylosporangium sp. AC04546 TaxID=2862460 RepID=UPI001EDEF359|nr:hypothetical protein [Dactylosporangium sp. AC04546]WVK84352.1 hypothetical protein KZZ52_02635 [Dactylosporangium sp. AC04546]
MRTIGVTALLLLGVAGLLTIAVRGVLHDRHQTRGTVTVTACAFETYGRHGDTYRCRGRFAGPFDVAAVSFTNLGDLPPGATVEAAVSGPGDDTADLVSEGYWRLVLTLGGSLVLLGLVAALWRARSGKLAR